jgi:hypothetical protein
VAAEPLVILVLAVMEALPEQEVTFAAHKMEQAVLEAVATLTPGTGLLELVVALEYMDKAQVVWLEHAAVW